MKNLDFLEIGTSDFDTLIQKCSDQDTGLVIEPLKYYLDRLPDKPKVTKLQLAVSFNDKEEMGFLYYIHPDDILKHNLPFWLRGCNKIGDFHFQHIKLGIQHLIRKEEVLLVPISRILKEHEVQEIGILKIDTEGADCQILLRFFLYLKENKKSTPKQIIFENNGLTCPVQLQEVLKVATELGYIIGRQQGDELVLNYLV